MVLTRRGRDQYLSPPPAPRDGASQSTPPPSSVSRGSLLKFSTKSPTVNYARPTGHSIQLEEFHDKTLDIIITIISALWCPSGILDPLMQMYIGL